MDHRRPNPASYLMVEHRVCDNRLSRRRVYTLAGTIASSPKGHPPYAGEIEGLRVQLVASALGFVF
jgi:hypothetical protein